VDPVFQKPLKFIERLTTIINSSLFGFNGAGRTFQDANAVEIENSASDDLKTRFYNSYDDFLKFQHKNYKKVIKGNKANFFRKFFYLNII